MTKPELRRWAKQVRSEQPIPELSQRVAEHLAGFLEKQGVGHILLYSAFGSELDPSPLPALYPAQYYLPRVHARDLEVHPLPCSLVRHPYGFLEPAPEAPRAAPENLEAVLVPGLAFDPWGRRLGYGQGFYDRFLARLPPHVLTIGLTPRTLLVPTLPHDPWDVPVGFLATEAGVCPALRAR
ncbi:MAG: 5-formyltetrahydrofolate cyclo-ligase [Meiothermus sp.]|uniref:5-formyltetrahydrofolate cyclo-ligase n=1 Tax=Meiothermus sp. TaxID=1955249 RepID=UPI0025F6920B|nr:5-formyltetrahydrofolate cyclo-ligase [Meiothermus sp.]MCS7058585.1 5-formyltetrahydrofolate cyclo-ligase [Meiothermus sp.]MCS7193766.1 5-formyltetrahydrofolate cyclo-ligase [Meiothermus sp.]MCX7739649.1 5-formyltetrahydrofolate cyclo-ligase [Meiothermus sp.]MDW8091642.1 5-formyltetrahydrofolate cyclo-ligase [Meiothermus sp.]MDW8481957.1 5-formyltetrahydrofolate cyclo-ligase [Meiothermus sp.]